MNDFERAIASALEWHSGQTRQESGNPYVVHPINVGRLLGEYGYPEYAVDGVLHDSVEDERVTPEELARLFGGRVLDSVTHISRKRKPNGKWAETKLEFASRVRTAPFRPRVVKVADTLDNLMEIQRTYNREGEEAAFAFMRGDNMTGAQRYRSYVMSLEAMADDTWTEARKHGRPEGLFDAFTTLVYDFIAGHKIGER